jgi:hypothetical protein
MRSALDRSQRQDWTAWLRPRNRRGSSRRAWSPTFRWDGWAIRMRWQKPSFSSRPTTAASSMEPNSSSTAASRRFECARLRVSRRDTRNQPLALAAALRHPASASVGHRSRNHKTAKALGVISGRPMEGRSDARRRLVIQDAIDPIHDLDPLHRAPAGHEGARERCIRETDRKGIIYNASCAR